MAAGSQALAGDRGPAHGEVVGDVGHQRAVDPDRRVVPAEGGARRMMLGESRRSPASDVQSIPPTKATRSSTIDSLLVVAVKRPLAAVQRAADRAGAAASSSRTARTARRDGRNTGIGAPAQSSTRTSARRAVSASRSRTTTGRSPSSAITKSGDRNQAVRWTCETAERTSSTIDLSAASPSISTSSRVPSRGGAAPLPSAQPPGGGSRALLPSRRSRREWCRRTPAAMRSPTSAVDPRQRRRQRRHRPSSQIRR